MFAMTWRKSAISNIESGPGAALFDYVCHALEAACRGPQDAAHAMGVTAGVIFQSMWDTGVIRCEEDIEKNCSTRRLLASLKYLSSGLTTFAATNVDSKDRQKAKNSLREAVEIAETGNCHSVRKATDSDSRKFFDFDAPSMFVYDTMKRYLKAALKEHLGAGGSTCGTLLVAAGARATQETYEKEDRKSFKAAHQAVVKESKKNREISRYRDRDIKLAYCMGSEK